MEEETLRWLSWMMHREQKSALVASLKTKLRRRASPDDANRTGVCDRDLKPHMSSTKPFRAAPSGGLKNPERQDHRSASHTRWDVAVSGANRQADVECTAEMTEFHTILGDARLRIP